MVFRRPVFIGDAPHFTTLQVRIYAYLTKINVSGVFPMRCIGRRLFQPRPFPFLPLFSALLQGGKPCVMQKS